MRIPNKGTPWLVGPDGRVRPATENEVSEIWFHWLQDIDARVGNIPPPTPPAPPPPFSANIQFQDDGVDVGTANPRYVNARTNLTATYDATLNRIDLDAVSDVPESLVEAADLWWWTTGNGTILPTATIGTVSATTTPAVSTATPAQYVFRNIGQNSGAGSLFGHTLAGNVFPPVVPSGGNGGIEIEWVHGFNALASTHAFYAGLSASTISTGGVFAAGNLGAFLIGYDQGETQLSLSYRPNLAGVWTRQFFALPKFTANRLFKSILTVSRLNTWRYRLLEATSFTTVATLIDQTINAPSLTPDGTNNLTWVCEGFEPTAGAGGSQSFLSFLKLRQNNPALLDA